MGKSRKVVALQSGQMSKEAKEKRRREENMATSSKELISSKRKLPDGLIDDQAISEYKRVRKLLEQIDVICDLDVMNLVNYCNAFSNHKNIVKQMKDQEYVLEKETQYGTQLYKNPLINAERDYADEMRKFASLCGMSIDSRLKAAAIKTSEKKDNISEKFGAI